MRLRWLWGIGSLEVAGTRVLIILGTRTASEPAERARCDMMLLSNFPVLRRPICRNIDEWMGEMGKGEGGNI